MSMVIFFDMHSCVFNNRTKTSHHSLVLSDYIYMVTNNSKVHLGVIILYISLRVHVVAWHSMGCQLDLLIELN